MRALRHRLAGILALQLAVLGVLATGALGTGQGSGQVAASPQLSSLTSAAHDTSVPLDQAPPLENDPNRVIPELERTTAANVSPATPDAAAQLRVGASPTVGSPLQSFDGISRLSMGSTYYPPDTVGDVGPSQFVEAVNGGFDVFSKTGTSLTGGMTDTAFWSGLSGCTGVSLSDPTVNYDQFADRWVYAELAYTMGSGATWSGPFTECVAVSTTGDATGSWNRYAFNIDAPRYRWLPDYPKLGVWPDGYYLSFNDYDSTSHAFVGAGAMALERSKMLTGASAQAVFFDLRGVAGLDGGMLPADADGATQPPANAPDYFVTPVDNASNDQVGIWAFHVDWANPAASSFTNAQALPVSAFDGNGSSVPQPGTGVMLDGLADDRMMNRLQYRNFGGYETLVTDETVNSGSSSDAPRWYELRRIGGSWSVNQQSTFMPDAVNRWMGSAAMNGAGDVALAYSAGDASTYAGLRYTGRQVGDPLSTMGAEQVLVGGRGAQTGTTRWGDYSQLSVDPTDDCTFWYVGEYYGATSSYDWSTRIGSFRVSACSSGVSYSAVPAISGTTHEGSTLTATAGTWSDVPVTTAYQWRRCDTTGIACTDIPGATLGTYALQAADAGKRVRVMVSVTTASGNGSAVSAATTAIVPNAPVNQALPTVSGTTQVGYTLGASTGSWTSAVTPTYTYQWQSCVGLTCTDIAGANAATYVIGSAYVNAKIRVGVTAVNAGGAAAVYSAQTATVTYPPAPVNVSLPSVSGTAQQSRTLTASTGSWSGALPISYGYQWLRCNAAGSSCGAITGQTGFTYGMTSADVGSTLRVTVTATNTGGVTAQDSAPSAVVLPLAPVNTGVPTVSGGATVGSTLAASSGTWTSLAGYPINYAYQWQRCTGSSCVDIVTASSSQYDVGSADAGSNVRVAVTASNAGGSTVAYSAAVAIPAAASGGSSSGGSSSGGGSSPGGGSSSGGSSSGGSSSGGSYSGGGSSPNLAVTGIATPMSPLPGDTVTFAITVTDKNLLAATRLLLTATIPAGMTYVSGSADRGSGCTQSSTDATKVTCNLDYLSADSPEAHVLLYAKVTATGPLSVSVNAVSQELGDSDTSDNTFTVALNAATTTSSGAPRGINGDGTTSTTKTDKKAPTAQALASSGARGGTAKLRFTIYDDSGVAKAVATVKRDGSAIATAKSGFGPVAYGGVYYVGWQVPRAAPTGRYTFCVTAYDQAAHHSATTCAPLALR